MRIAFIGGGNMANALIGGLVKRGTAPRDILAIDVNESTREGLVTQHNIETASAPNDRLRDYDTLVLAVKPQVLKDVAQALQPHLNGQLVISIAAGIRASDLARWLGGHNQIVRCMPNTPALIGKGITGLIALSGVDSDQRKRAENILSAAGEIIWVDKESQLDAVTAISGSGPAYVFYFIEALEQAAQELGFSPAQGRQLAIATFMGASQLAANSPEPASVLRDRVTSKGGTTFAAISQFEKDAVKDAIVRGVKAANHRAKELGDELGKA
ncbi:pyrroline-5-carboxylate reductase [Pandoraea faecigallinarum]|uniref:Pyrroline-5-carboxylate reductase n=1 Tax=Pandoraea faecigallinarum TaxID=656179 RepID=A0A0H3WPU5_9BURK|nr:pyrroline-5-carboxylate reductase [Pandoraea faecigallinarum]AKM29882.1 pyrroline-5-carboxylate reductase [Pandoraea faecigallinarum]